jgi:acetyl/propionyl-CoA carboxylase alpha subunit
MNLFHFSDSPNERHRAQREPGSGRVRVDDTLVSVQQEGPNRFVAPLDGRSVRLHAVADGDRVWVHWRGRAWALERIDPTRSSAAGAAEAAGTAHAPMPGVVVSLLVAPGQAVAEGDALLVIESMKLQTTIGAAAAGVVIELPFAVGQTFQRGAVLARLETTEAP